jgi:poly(3-hydroxybutyrate) depolymerase
MLSSIPRKNLQTAFTGDQDAAHFTRKTHVFKSCGTNCEGWLYLPKGRALPPVVLMAHGETML